MKVGKTFIGKSQADFSAKHPGGYVLFYLGFVLHKTIYFFKYKT